MAQFPQGEKACGSSLVAVRIKEKQVCRVSGCGTALHMSPPQPPAVVFLLMSLRRVLVVTYRMLRCGSRALELYGRLSSCRVQA